MSMTPADLTNLERLLAEYEKPVYHTDDRLQVTINLEAALVAAAPDLIKCARERDRYEKALLVELTELRHRAATEWHDKGDPVHAAIERIKAALSAGQTGGKDAQ